MYMSSQLLPMDMLYRTWWNYIIYFALRMYEVILWNYFFEQYKMYRGTGSSIKQRASGAVLMSSKLLIFRTVLHTELSFES